MSETYQTPTDFGTDPEGIVRRWVMELKLADKRDDDFLKTGKKVWDVYRGKGRKKNSFNVLWSNTETLAPAVFNSPPQPNVRRRFKDKDPVGKVASEMLERCLTFQTDTEPFMSAVADDVLDMLLPGRGVSRIRYVPSLVQVGTPEPDEEAEEPTHEAMEGDAEELDWEQVVLEHVQWDDFRHGPGKTWNEVGWVAFRHRMTRDDLIKLAGEKIGKAVTLDEPADDDLKKDDDLCEVFQTAEVWEIWCKDERVVKFICKSYKASPLKVVQDPLGLGEFFPNPKPLMAVQDSASLEPIALYEQYKEQAEELNRVSTRINKIVDACKLRGIYDATMAELAELMRAADNDLVPAQNGAMWAEKGGFEKAIWMWPAKDAAEVLQILQLQREATKQVIYEITGIADVMRGSTDPNETLGAQELKAQFGGQRVKSMQREVQRYVRDQIRLMAEVAAEKFQPETLLKMTNMEVPTQEQVMQQQQQAMLQAQASGQAAQPPAQPPVTLEQVMAVLRDDATRMFKIDVETDSMIAATMQQDMQALEQVLGGITQLVQGLGPAVQAGAMPVEAVKEMILAVSRRARLGTVVEDALEKIQPPAPQVDPNQAKAEAEQAKVQAKKELDEQALQHKMQLDQIELAHNQKMEQQRAEADMAIEAQRQQGEMARAQQDAAFQRQLEMFKAQQESVREQEKAQREQELQLILAKIEQATTLKVAEMNNETTKETAKMAADAKPKEKAE